MITAQITERVRYCLLQQLQAVRPLSLTADHLCYGVTLENIPVTREETLLQLHTLITSKHAAMADGSAVSSIIRYAITDEGTKALVTAGLLS